MANVLLARMGEITLKGLNRGSFEIQLKSNLKYRLKRFGNLKIYQSQSRIWIEPKEEDNPNFQSMAAAEDIMKVYARFSESYQLALQESLKVTSNPLRRTRLSASESSLSRIPISSHSRSRASAETRLSR